MDTFSSTPTSHGIWNMHINIVRDDGQIQLVPVSISFIILGAHMNILFIVKWRFSWILNDHICPPNDVDYWVNKVEQIMSMESNICQAHDAFLVSILRSTLNHTPLKCRFLVQDE